MKFSLNYPSTKVVVATCNLNNWAMDFDGNAKRIYQSILNAKNLGAKFRVGPELEISGYGCEDHFLEDDTFIHSDQSLAYLLSTDLTDNILCDIGCPILHHGVRYNCRVFCLNRKIVLIRPKLFLADDGNYREGRFFTAWKSTMGMQEYILPDILQAVTEQDKVPFGVAVIATKETMVSAEICEELWTPNSPHISQYLSGVEIISNGSGSHHQLRKLDSRLALIRGATQKCGGVYLYANHRGCDGGRLYFDGSSLICVNGDIVGQASQFSLMDVEVVTAVVDLADVRAYRGGPASLQQQASLAPQLPTIDLRSFSLCGGTISDISLPPLRTSPPLSPLLLSPEQECCLGPACWLWDYLRRAGAAGFLLPLSGGADSAAVAAIVRAMCGLAADAAAAGDPQVLQDMRRLMPAPTPQKQDSYQARKTRLASKADGDKSASAAPLSPSQEPSSAPATPAPPSTPTAQELCSFVLHTVYMGTQHSSVATRNRAAGLAEGIGAWHNTFSIDTMVSAVLLVFSTISGGRMPRFETQGGSAAEDLALQNIQARLRMVMSYLCAQLFPWLRGRPGFLLVLGAANVDESLRGYMTKYDCSSADVNPIGGICKGDLKKMLRWAATEYSLPVLEDILQATPTAELRPIKKGATDDEHTQTDEEDMGMSYAELGVFGTLRKIRRCGPVAMFLQLLDRWTHLTPADVAAKVKRFFYFYSVNRHKQTVLTPSYHAENYGTDDNRFDLRQFLYNTRWTRQFDTIDSLAAAQAAKPPAPPLSPAQLQPKKLPFEE